MAKMGRPKKVIDWVTFDKLCALHCTAEEIAGILGISTDTIDVALKKKKTSFPEYFRQKSSNGKLSLRRKQYEVAMRGDKTMLIWLGKNWLNQKDKQEITNTITTDDSKLVIDLGGFDKDKSNDNES